MATPANTRVEIYDQSYSIGGENDAAYLQKLADRVDGVMRQVARNAHAVDSMRVAVMAAINLADENEALRAEVAGLREQLETRTQAVSRRLDRLLSSAG